MTKTEKKEIVFDLVKDFKTAEDVTTLKYLKKEIIEEVSACPFSDDIKLLFELSLLSWNTDIETYIQEKELGKANLDLNEMAVESVVGIYNFIDESLLED